jgi:ABC-type transport system involved in multi-copper enzyme maturation permease subunit
MTRFWAICQNTFVQTIRQPIYAVLILATMALLVMSLPLAGWTMGTEGDYQVSDQLMLETLGLSTLLVSGLLVAAFSASGALSREIEDRTALTVISKPVSRATFVLGKFAGVAGAVLAAFYLCSLVFLMTVRHKVMSAAWHPYDFPVIVLGCSAMGLSVLTAMLGNLFFGWPFISAWVYAALVLLSAAMGLIGFIGKGWTIVPLGHEIRPQLIVALVLTVPAVLVLTAVAVAVSTRLGQVMTLLVCTAVFVAGSAYEPLFGAYADAVNRMVGWAFPKLTYFYALDALTLGKDIPLDYVAGAAGYAALYVGAALAVGVALFQGRQLEAEVGSTAAPGAVNLLAWAGRGAAIVLALVAAKLVARPENRDAASFLVAAGLLGAAVASWLLWGWFGRGVGWSYRIVLGLSGLFFLRNAALLGAPGATGFLRFRETPELLFLEAVLGAAVLLILLLPRTRRHFKPAS